MCVHVSENTVIVSKIIFYQAENIPESTGKCFFTLLCIKMVMVMYQCIIFHHALCHHTSCNIININPMVHMYCVRKGGENFKMTTCIKNFTDEHLNLFTIL
jgi:hypothetical protein